MYVGSMSVITHNGSLDLAVCIQVAEFATLFSIAGRNSFWCSTNVPMSPVSCSKLYLPSPDSDHSESNDPFNVHL